MTTVLLWTVDEAARQLGGVSARTVRRMLATGELPKVKVRGAVRIPAQAVRN
jgi:excisionase family DNA binding protein